MIRSLQLLEDQIAHGNTTAQAAQPKLIAHIGEKFLTADPKLWQTPVNARAAVLYLFSGGRPQVVRTLLDRGNIAKDFLDITKGALAYAEGRNNDARVFLRDIDPRSLPSNLGGHLALVLSMLMTDKERPQAMQMLDLARLLVPGTLVEEAAMRREIFVLADAGSIDKFLSLAARYALRFGTSVYAENFRQLFAASLNSLGLTRDVAHVARIEIVTRELPVADQRKLYLMIARSAIIRGKVDVAAYAAQKALGLVTDAGRDEARSKLYLGASMIVTEKYDAGLAILQKVDKPRLSQSDVQLYDAALELAKALRKRAEIAKAAPPQADTSTSGEAAARPDAAAPPALQAAATPSPPQTPANPAPGGPVQPAASIPPANIASATADPNAATVKPPGAAAQAPSAQDPTKAGPPPAGAAMAAAAPGAAAQQTPATAPFAEPPPEIDLAEKALADSGRLLKEAKP
jgi:chemotaxis protein MotC